ncbi:cyclopropane-fatty-acyl-phospholipid synthase family protein [Parasalinivibrio latis]|uniref:class I SAM-dependent methyltransferase n=1 Tax=Parasalinivibrio latis TaxID=2952610 RepID=UPI0030E328A9
MSSIDNNVEAFADTQTACRSRKIVSVMLGKMKGASIELTEPDGQVFHYGDPHSDIHAVVQVNDTRFYNRMLTGGSIGAAEAYVDGWWDTPDITAVVRTVARNMGALDELEAKLGWLTSIREKWLHWTRRNTLSGSKDNIAAHYDLGNDLYSRFLDKEMLYSSGIYNSSQDSLDTAQLNKMDRLCQQLDLSPADHLLEIGTGWGGMAIYAAKHYGCRVTTTTISNEQYQWAKQRVEEEGLTEKITLLTQDYRELTGQFDKLVSVEMIEAVGKSFLPGFVRKCESLLKPGGKMAIQAITIADQRYEHYSRNVDFIQKHIFPGGFLPSISALQKVLTDETKFVTRNIQDLGIDYADTLKDWLKRFNQHEDDLKSIGYDDRFLRLWRYYFCYCEGGFREKTISTIQLTAELPQRY